MDADKSESYAYKYTKAYQLHLTKLVLIYLHLLDNHFRFILTSNNWVAFF